MPISRISARDGRKSRRVALKLITSTVRATTPLCTSSSQTAKRPMTAGSRRTPSISSALPKSKRPLATMLSMPTVEIMMPIDTVTMLRQIEPRATMTTLTTARKTSENLSCVRKSRANLLIGMAMNIRTSAPIMPPIVEANASSPSAFAPSPRCISACPSMVVIAPDGAPGMFTTIPVMLPA